MGLQEGPGQHRHRRCTDPVASEGAFALRRAFAAAFLVAALLGGCGRAPSRDGQPVDARTVARVEEVRLSLLPAVEARDALVADNAAKSAQIAQLTAELERARSAAVARSTASRGGRRTSVAPARAVGPCGGWTALVGAYAWPVGTMCSVLVCESGGNPNARNGSHNGLFQIAGGPFDPAANVRLAFSMYQRRGTQPWDASASCWG